MATTALTMITIVGCNGCFIEEFFTRGLQPARSFLLGKPNLRVVGENVDKRKRTFDPIAKFPQMKSVLPLSVSNRISFVVEEEEIFTLRLLKHCIHLCIGFLRLLGENGHDGRDDHSNKHVRQVHAAPRRSTSSISCLIVRRR